MSKYRFKNREEFIRDGLWNDKSDCPYNWASNGEMNEYLGKDVPDECIIYCDKKEDFEYDGWLFQNTNYVLKEQQEYFDDLSQHIGRYIRALVDNPSLGHLVRRGNVGKIISNCRADFLNHKAYYCKSALSEDYLGTKYELLPEDYSPEQEVKKPSIEFIPGKWYKYNGWYIKYKDHVDDVWRSSEQINYSKKYSKIESRFGDRDSDDKKILLLDLSEIQKYLPDEHPDKVINQKFEIGKWYKWYQKNHGKYHYGKVERINLETDTVVMKPWILQCDEYQFSGHFALSEAEQIQEISVEQVKEFLPKDHPDKISSDEFKKGECIVISNIESLNKDFVSNYIYKQRENCKYFCSELDNHGKKTNGWQTIEKKNSHNWRYATQEEIDEYERRGKPYDVTELNKQSFPKENITEVPEYIECTETKESYFIKGNIYKVINSSSLTSAILVSNLDLCNLKAGTQLFCLMESYGKKYWKPSTKEAYEQQKPLNYESVSGCFPTDKKMLIHDEVDQSITALYEYWKNVPKFVEQDFDIYGPTPDIE